MKALITAGGRGTRLRPITHSQNKHLIPIANRPILQYAFDTVAAAGITDVGVIVGVDNGEEVCSRFGDGSQLGLRLSYIWQEAPLGLAHAVRIARPFIGDEAFVFYLGDNIVVGGIERFVDAFRRDDLDCLLAIARVRDPGRFGVPTFDADGRLVGVTEKPEHPASPYAVSGIYVYSPRIFDAVEAIAAGPRGEFEISEAHDWLIANGCKVGYREITGWWKDTGMPSDLLEANRMVLSGLEQRIDGEVDADSDIAGTVVVERGARIVASRIRGPAIIGAGTQVIDSYIGPYSSVGADSMLQRCEVEYSILMDRVRVEDVDVRVEGSILGNDVEICRGIGKPRVQRFVLGGQSRVELV